MVDRTTIFPGQLPLETDLLAAQQFGMIGLGELALAVLGGATAVAGFELFSTTVPSLGLVLGPGQIYALDVVEKSQWSSLPPDNRTLLRQGVLLDPSPFTLLPPNTAGYSQVVLLQAEFNEQDIAPVERPYYNSANPSVGFTGPGNDGQADNTVRQNSVSIGIKYGTAAPAGTQVAPAPDPGYVGLYLVTLSTGQTQITSANWVQYTPSPFIPVRLPEVPAGVQNGLWTYAQGTGSANALQATVYPVPATLVPGLSVRVRVPFTNTGSCTFTLNNLPTKALLARDGTQLNSGDLANGSIVDLVYNGSAWQLLTDRSAVAATVGVADNSLWHIGTPTSGTTTALTTVLSPVPAIAGNGLCMRVPITATNGVPAPNGQTTLDFGFGPKPIIIDRTGGVLNGGEMPGAVGHFADFIYDGTSCRLMNPVVATPASQVPLAMAATSNTTVLPNGPVVILANWGGIVANTFATSTFDGQTFTVGAGEGGFYQLSASISLNALAYDCSIEIIYNGNRTGIRAGEGDGVNQSEAAASVSGGLQLVPGDKITTRFHMDTGGGARTLINCNFTVVRLRS